MKIDRNTLAATVENTDVVILETDCGHAEEDVTVYRDATGKYHVVRNGVARHPDSGAEDVMRALGVYLQSALYKRPGPGERRMQTPADLGPIQGEAIAQRMMSICGCQGRHDCQCVSVCNQAGRELYGEYNLKQRLGHNS